MSGFSTIFHTIFYPLTGVTTTSELSSNSHCAIFFNPVSVANKIFNAIFLLDFTFFEGEITQLNWSGIKALMKHKSRLLLISPLNVDSTFSQHCTMFPLFSDVSLTHNTFFVATSFISPFHFAAWNLQLRCQISPLYAFSYNENFLLMTCVVAKLKFIWAARVDVRGFKNGKIAFITQRTHW